MAYSSYCSDTVLRESKAEGGDVKRSFLAEAKKRKKEEMYVF